MSYVDLVPALHPPVVLLAFANADGLAPLRNLAEEERQIELALRPLVQAGELEVKTLWNATPDRIVGVFQEQRYRGRIRIFHFGGHASHGEFMLVDVTGAAAATPAAPLAAYLGRQAGLALVFLNGCSTRGQVDRLRGANIGAVVSTSRAIVDAVAATFAANLYAELRHRPLREAFEAASEATQSIRDGQLRETVVEQLGPEDGATRFPWELECEDDGWRMPMTPRKPDPECERQCRDELIGSATDPELAVRLVKEAGFPPGMIPRFGTAYVFWSKIAEDAGHGALRGGLQPIIDTAAKIFPNNEVFARCRSQR